MSNTKTLILGAALIAALSTIFLQHCQNAALERRIIIITEEKAGIEAQAAATAASALQNSSPPRVQELETEVTRLRGAAARASRAEAENAQLRAELQRQRPVTPRASGEAPAPNPQALTDYIGSAVAVPANLDPAYTQQGLSGAIQAAADKAGITLKRIGVDDSEFPFVLGVNSEPGDWEKLKTQLKSLEGYEFQGSVGDDTSHTFSLTPSGAYPPGASQTISRRMTLRLQKFYHQFTAGAS